VSVGVLSLPSIVPSCLVFCVSHFVCVDQVQALVLLSSPYMPLLPPSNGLNTDPPLFLCYLLGRPRAEPCTNVGMAHVCHVVGGVRHREICR